MVDCARGVDHIAPGAAYFASDSHVDGFASEEDALERLERAEFGFEGARFDRLRVFSMTLVNDDYTWLR